MESGKRELSPPARVHGHSGPDDHQILSAVRSDRRNPRCSGRSSSCSHGSAGSCGGREGTDRAGPALGSIPNDAAGFDRQRSASSPPATAPSDAQRSEARPRLQSLVVGPMLLPFEEVDGSNCHPWFTVTSRHSRRRASSPLSARRPPMPRIGSPNRADRPAPSSASVAARAAARAAFLRRFNGRCFRCLSRDHRRAECRDPPRCIECWAWGHRATESQRCKASRPRAPVRSRLVFPPRPAIQHRLRFPAPPPTSAMLGQIQAKPAPRRSGSSHTVIMASRAVEHQIFSLRSKGVLVKALDGPHTATPFSIGKAVEAALKLPPHLLRVTKHYPEDFFIHFDVPSHRDKAVRQGSITVDGSTFLLQAWRESEHGVFQTYNLHVRICIEKMPLHLWSFEGAKEVLGKDVIVDRLDSRTNAQDNTKLFSCWVWCWSLDRIPSDHGFTVFPRGAGSIEEMNGFSPPSRVVPPAPEGIRFDALIHIDLVEDWTVREARTPSSRQSGLPSSSSEVAPPFPAVQPYTWLSGVPDGEEVRSNTRRRLLDPCAGGPAIQRRDDRNDDNDRQRRARQDAAHPLGRDRRTAPPSQSQRGLDGSRRRSRSRTPSSRRRSDEAGLVADISALPPPPPPPLPTSGPMPQRFDIDKTGCVGMAATTPVPEATHEVSQNASPASPASDLSDDPLAELAARNQLDGLSWPSLGSDPMAFELDAFCSAATSRPLSFPPSPAPPLLLGFDLSPAQGQHSPRSPMDMPDRAAASHLLLGRSPLGPGSLADDVSSVVSQVAQLELTQEQDGEGPREFLDVLFAAPPASILGTTPPTPGRVPATPKGKATTASRRSIRQAELPNSVPVAQRATVRLAKELDVIADDEQRLEAAAAALTERLDYPLMEVDLDGLAVLTRIDKDAIKRAAAQAAIKRAAAMAQ